MKLNVKALACACAVVWGLGVFTTAVANLIWPTYGADFLRQVASIYPGYAKMSPGFGQVIVGTLYALVDAGVAGAILACTYNCCAGTAAAKAATSGR